METTTISLKYQLVIPKDVRNKLKLKSGQKMSVVTKGGVIHLIPEKNIDSFKGFLKGIDTKNLREGKSR